MGKTKNVDSGEKKPMQVRVTFLTKNFPELEKIHDLGFDVQKVMSDLLSKTLPIKLKQIEKEKEISLAIEEEIIRESLKK